MLVYAGLDGKIDQVGPSHPPGSQMVIGGRFAIPLPAGVELPLDGSAHLFPRDGKDVTTSAFAELARQLPGVSGFYVNPLLSAADVAALDFDGVLVDDSVRPSARLPARFGSGREPGPEGGMLGCSTFLPGVNSAVSPPRPGLVVTKPIDLRSNLPVCRGKVVYPARVRAYWQLQRLETTLDASSDVGAMRGEVVGQKVMTELSHHPDGFAAYFSVDGKSFCKVGLLDPIQPCDRLDRVVLAFRNDSPLRLHLVHYGLFF